MANISKIKVGNTSYGITATPTAHASTATTYGAASASKYGHVKLSDNYTSSAGTAASGIGASSLAVYNAYNTLNSNLSECVYPSVYPITMDTSSFVATVESFIEQKGITTYSADDVKAVIPVGARKNGMTTIYPAMYDGTYIRCEAVEGAILYVCLFHKV